MTIDGDRNASIESERKEQTSIRSEVAPPRSVARDTERARAWPA
jgi:hypothetical protein